MESNRSKVLARIAIIRFMRRMLKHTTILMMYISPTTCIGGSSFTNMFVSKLPTLASITVRMELVKVSNSSRSYMKLRFPTMENIKVNSEKRIV